MGAGSENVDVDDYMDASYENEVDYAFPVHEKVVDHRNTAAENYVDCTNEGSEKNAHCSPFVGESYHNYCNRDSLWQETV